MGLPPGMIYRSFDEDGPEKIADLVRQSIEQTFGDVSGTQTDGLHVLSSDERLALGILVTAALPRRIEYYNKLLPSIAWEEILPRLKDLGLVDDTHQIPTATATAERAYPVEASE